MLSMLRGRQAEARRNDELILTAAREVLIEQGATAPVSAIAQRAGVGIGALYRRYPAKEDLVRQLCVDSMEFTVREAAAALAEPDAWPAFVGFMHRCMDAAVGGLSHLAGSFTVTDEIWALGERVRQSIQALVDRAHAEGPMRPGITAADVCFLLQQLGPARGGGKSIVAGCGKRYLTVMLDGLCGVEPLPGASATWQEGELLWRTSPR
jgi:AcrR family transcriptional regulator